MKKKKTLAQFAEIVSKLFQTFRNLQIRSCTRVFHQCGMWCSNMLNFVHITGHKGNLNSRIKTTFILTCTLWAGPGAATRACAITAAPPASACSSRHSWLVMLAISSCRRSVSTLISAIFSAADAVKNASLRSTRWRVLLSSRRTNLRSSSNWLLT